MLPRIFTILLLTSTLRAADLLPVPDKTVILTFDDGVSTHATYVAPLLKKYGFTATFFVCEFPPDFANKHDYMSWEQMANLHKMGFEVANHTWTHKHVDKLKPEQLVEQLEYIEKKITGFGAPRPVTFAYPGYATSGAAIAVLRARGYQFARGGEDRVYDPKKDDPMLIPGFTTRKDNKEMILTGLQKAKDGKIAVLTIHGVPDYAHDWVTTPPELFEFYLRYLKENKFNVIAFRDLTKYVGAPMVR
jgi:peptidoglycan-N-acetylglucosamine deacetylase